LEKIVNIIESIAHEKGLKIENVKEALKIAMIRTAKKIYGEEYDYDVEIDEKNKKLKLFQKVVVIPDEDDKEELDHEKFITLKEAKEIDPNVEAGDELTYELPLDNLGRTAAATLHRELEYHIQRALERVIFEKYKNKIGKIVFGTVTRVDPNDNTYIEIDEVQAILPKRNRIKGEKFKPGDVVKSVIRKVNIDRVDGMTVELSRTTPKFLEELLKTAVPEIKDELILIQKAARIPGERAKVALTSLDSKIDPVGATVGVKGVRINSVSKELDGENIDCIEYSSVPEIFVSRAMAPAIISSVKMEGDKAVVTVPSDQKSKAIGKSGINIRLASMLTGHQIELKEIKQSSPQPAVSSTKNEEVIKNINALKDLFGD